jgi:hypothetical protein
MIKQSIASASREYLYHYKEYYEKPQEMPTKPRRKAMINVFILIL